MRDHPLTAIVLRPAASGELVLARSPQVAVGVNAFSGTALALAMAISLLQLMTPGLVLALGLLYGPLGAFFVTSLYARIEWRVGRWLGGRGRLDDLYRLCSWAFLPFSLAFPLLVLTARIFPGPGLASSVAALLPPLVLVGWTLRTYAGNLFRVQQFSRARGCLCLALSLALFLVVVTGGMALLTLLVRHGAGDYWQSLMPGWGE